MTEQKRKPRAAGPRTEVFAMRLDPKLKYLAEIAARKQRRSLANFVEWAIEQALARVQLVESGFNGEGTTVTDASPQLWALDGPDRLIKLATHYPDLLSYEEQLIWRVICDYSAYNKDEKRWSRFKEANGFNFVQQCWTEIKAYAMSPENPETKEQLKVALITHDDIPI